MSFTICSMCFLPSLHQHVCFCWSSNLIHRASIHGCCMSPLHCSRAEGKQRGCLQFFFFFFNSQLCKSTLHSSTLASNAPGPFSTVELWNPRLQAGLTTISPSYLANIYLIFRNGAISTRVRVKLQVLFFSNLFRFLFSKTYELNDLTSNLIYDTHRLKTTKEKKKTCILCHNKFSDDAICHISQRSLFWNESCLQARKDEAALHVKPDLVCSDGRHMVGSIGCISPG